MKLRVVVAGRINDNSVKKLIDEYIKRINRYCQIEFYDLKVAEDVELTDKDAEKLLEYGKDFYKIALVINGKQYSSEDFADLINEILNYKKNVVFYIGSAFGFGKNSFLDRCDVKLSLSMMTMAHKVATIVLMEQLYRAFTIIKGHPYHK